MRRPEEWLQSPSIKLIRRKVKPLEKPPSGRPKSESDRIDFTGDMINVL
tara:strand:+ start:820 stop:966 length:147 start_codon:yes stop_codon:yes gene_type:complete